LLVDLFEYMKMHGLSISK